MGNGQGALLYVTKASIDPKNAKAGKLGDY